MIDTKSHRPFKNHLLVFLKGWGEEDLAFMDEPFTGAGMKPRRAREPDSCGVTQPSRWEGALGALCPSCLFAQFDVRTRQNGSM